MHDPRDVPLVRQQGFSVAPGTAANAAIRVRQVTRHSKKKVKADYVEFNSLEADQDVVRLGSTQGSACNE